VVIASLLGFAAGENDSGTSIPGSPAVSSNALP
jgi:hypothetical protein